MSDTSESSRQGLKEEMISAKMMSTEELKYSSPKDQELENLRKQLAFMSEAMRLLASQIRNADLTAHAINKMVMSDDQTVATDCDTVISEEESASVVHHRPRTFSAAASVDHTDMRLCEITDELSRSQTADLLTLQNAASMLQEHARLASHEAALAVHDAVQAQGWTDDWKQRALRAEDQCAALRDENVTLKLQNEKLALERRVLIKEVRKLRKAESTKQDYWKHFESYVKGAMNLHEQRLKKKPNDAADDFSTYSALSSDEGVTVTLKTDKPIHVGSETISRTSPPCTPTQRKPSAPTSVVGEMNHQTLSPLSIGKRTISHARSGPHGAMLKVSNFGGAMRRQVQRRFAKHEEAHRQQAAVGSPPESIDFYQSDCVSPVMSYDSIDGVWSVDSNHSKSSAGDTEPDKECSGCASLNGN